MGPRGDRHLGVRVSLPRLVLERPAGRKRSAALVVVGAEEPDLVLANGAADGAARLPVLLRLAGELLALTDVEEVGAEILAGPGLVVRRVADERVERAAAVELVAAGLGHDVHRGTREAAVFGLGAEADDAHFLDRVVVDVDERAEGSRLGVRRVDAVDEEHVLVRGAAVGRRARQRIRARRIEHPGHRQCEVVEGITAGREARDELLVDARVDRRRLGVDERALGRHGDRLGVRADGKHEIERHGRVGADVDVLAHDGLEPRERGGDRVAPRRQVEEHVRAVGRTDGRSGSHHRGAGNFDGRARHHGLILAGHRARQPAVVDGLCLRRRHRQAREQERETSGCGEASP